MEPPSYYPPPLHHSSRPTLGFPLGTALLLIVIFSLSGIFSCCYHWDKLRHLRGSFSDNDNDNDDPSASKPKPTHSEKLHKENESLPVVMPGDRIARFIALPCPCEPARQQKVAAVQQLHNTTKPPHVAVNIC
ncbi:hypothetical protein QVD17_10091 [Tagetes erecta]|uniref:Hydroxyproline-rich glycoprotein family protein n=1 Tax=Tagetes erecta TaxID=13708 RepID=A0AAD8NZ67_TARER|nr:hypothetical protein QVD17_10091 [Tagetes erecta]